MLKINMEYRKGILFVRLKGNLTKYTVRSFNEYLIPLISKNGIKYLVYNLGAITFIDDYGKASIEKGVNAVNSNQGKALVCNAKFNLNNKLNIVPDELAALSLIEV